MRLQRVESAKLVEFPETVEGFFGKVRWYRPRPFIARPRVSQSALSRASLSRTLRMVVLTWCTQKMTGTASVGAEHEVLS